MRKQLILASSSPRRQELLRQVNVPFVVRPANVDESQVMTIDPVDKVKQLAMLKGRHVHLKHSDEVILAADTVVSYNNSIFEKPQNQHEAREMMSALSGKSHDVYTGVMIRSSDHEVTFVERTQVEFYELTEAEINWYISTDDPYDKAGAYGIQSQGAVFVKGIIGDYFNVVGLPLSRTVKALKEFEIYPQ
ncbi:Maf family protein [Lentibacillus saliphilus]|uniref:Maf family protein n=1 Tax=Lentibacillus saliphilus TaxID=2737028 RepID=UPI001C306BDD|nr:Maf family protein [Lentibacillus saliphilus]